MEPETKPRVGVGVMILKDGKILLGKRKSPLGKGDYCFPGGHLEYGETFEECARRETSEETGIEIDNIEFVLLGNSKHYMPRHYIQINLKADWKSGAPKVMEPDKCEGWDWYDIQNLPEPMFFLSRVALDAYAQGFNYRDGI